MKRFDLVLLGAALVSGGIFLASLDRLWPLPKQALDTPRAQLETMARETAELLSWPAEQAKAGFKLDVDVSALSWLEHTLGTDQTRRLADQGLPLWMHTVGLKQTGTASVLHCYIHPATGLAGWTQTIEDDEKGPRLDSLSAWNIAHNRALELLGQDLTAWEVRKYGARNLDRRRDHDFLLERAIAPRSPVRLRLSVTVAGQTVSEVKPSLIVPPSFGREQRPKILATDTLRAAALGLFALLGCIAFLYKLRSLKKGLIGLRIPAIGAGLVVVCLGLSRLLRDGRLFDVWDPLSPQWMAIAKVLLTGSISDLLPALMVFSFLAAADALDQEAPRHRGIALRNFLTLRWHETDVGHASLRGFLLGLVAGGLLTGFTWVLTSFVPEARVDLQPRGFFLYGLNSFAPTLLIAVFFLQIALVEELGYRHFAGNALLRIRAGRVLAALIPAVIYGTAHAGLDFLPPGDPWWTRLLPITAVGLLWGLAFMRWDALTVIFSHWACDIFLFNRTRLESHQPSEILGALLCICIPLAPALVNLGLRTWHHHRGDPTDDYQEDPDFAGRDPESSFDILPEEAPPPSPPDDADLTPPTHEPYHGLRR